MHKIVSSVDIKFASILKEHSLALALRCPRGTAQLRAAETSEPPGLGTAARHALALPGPRQTPCQTPSPEREENRGVFFEIPPVLNYAENKVNDSIKI